MITDVSRELQQMQSGEYIPTQEEAMQQKQMAASVAERPGVDFDKFRLPVGGASMRNEDVSREAAQAGWGKSKYDTGEFVPNMDVENKRALEQSGFSKIGTGLMKGGITAAATAVNTTLGTIFGAGSAIYELAFDADGDGRSFMDTMDAATNNFISVQMTKLQNWSEQQFPNYRTAEERTDKYQREWWKHVGTANFIGDSLLKNFGFTVGAMAGGMAWTRLIGAGLSSKLASDIMKGAVAAAEGDAQASAILTEAANAIKAGSAANVSGNLARAGEALQRGTAVAVDANKIAQNLKNAAQSLNKMNAKLQLYGAAIGAMGEGTTEGLMAEQEFLDDYMQRLNQKYLDDIKNLQTSLLNELKDTDMVRTVVRKSSSGDVEYAYELNDKGQAYLQEKINELSNEYMKNKEIAENQGERLASTTFLLNLPILTTSNLIQFGRMFSGGWNTARKSATGLTTGLTIEAAEKTAPKITANYASKLAKKGATTGKTILNSLKVAGSESFEEMAQGTVSSGAKTVAENNISSFNNEGYDAEAINSVREWFSGMYEGGKEYLGDFKNWQEGFLGAITGLFGIPGKRWSGGIIGAYQEAKEEAEQSRKAADKLNTLVNSEEFQSKWHGYIRHLKYDNDMARALSEDNEYAWHMADDKQIISDVQMFADAGKLEDLRAIVESFGSITEVDAEGLRDVLKSDNELKDWAKNASNAEIVARVKKQADRLKDTINEYKEVYDALSARAPQNSSPEFLKELVFTAQQIKAMDSRFLEMFGETMRALDDPLALMAKRDEKGKFVSNEEALSQLTQWRDALEKAFAKDVVPTNIPAELDELLSQVFLDQFKPILKKNPEVFKKAEDMLKLSRERKEFYRKLQTLQGEAGQKEFEAEAVTPQKVEEEAEKAAARLETAELKTLNDVKEAYFSKDANGRSAYIGTLEAIESTNPAAKEFLQIKRRFDAFQEWIKSNPISSADITVTKGMVQSMLNDLPKRAMSEEDLKNLPDNIFTPLDQFNLENQNPFGVPSPTAYASTKQAIRAAMTAYLGLDTATGSRMSLNSFGLPAATEPGTVDTPTGYDASQPASLESAPTAGKKTTAEPVPKANKETDVEIVNNPTEDQLMNDEAEAAKDDTPESVEDEKIHVEGQKDKLSYYRTSVPEIDTGEAKKARRAILVKDREALSQADLSDFVKSHPEYSDIWNALQQRGAFEAVPTVEIKDEVEFIVDPSFPTYNGKYQVLIAKKVGDKHQVLTVLSGQSSKYYGLAELHNAIDEEYQSFKESHPNDVFVFSKTSKVWLKRAGLIDYDFSASNDYSAEKSIVDVPGYDKNAPIVFINRNGIAEVVYGEDKEAAGKVSDVFDDAEHNRESGRRGSLYYLAKAPNGRFEYVPIRLWVEHFRPDNSSADNSVFTDIRAQLTDISNLVGATTTDNIANQGSMLANTVKRLGELLDLSNIDFVLKDFGNETGVALAINTNEGGERKEGKMFRPDQISPEKLIEYIASLNRSINIKQDEKGNVRNFGELIESGCITTNARMLRPKGSDFYINPWIPEKQMFGPVTVTQEQVGDVASSTVKHPVSPLDMPATEDDFLGGRDDFGMLDDDADPAYDEQPVVEAPAEIDEAVAETEDASRDKQAQRIRELVHKKYSELPGDIQAAVKAKGYTEEEYDKIPDTLKVKILACL